MPEPLYRSRPGGFDIQPASQEAAQRILDGVYLSRGLSNSFLIVTPEGRVVINTGMGFEAPVHKRNYDAVADSPIRYVILTQGHVDHVGGYDHMAGEGTELIEEAVLERLDDPDVQIRRKVAAILGELSNPGTMERVIDRLQIESDPEVLNDALRIMQRALKRVGAENHYFFCGRDIIGHKSFNLTIEDAATGAASKDGSSLTISESTIKNTKYFGLIAYAKKPEYGSASIDARNIKFEATEIRARVQKGSYLLLEGEQVKAEDMDVEQLYETIMKPGLKSKSDTGFFRFKVFKCTRMYPSCA